MSAKLDKGIVWKGKGVKRLYGFAIENNLNFDKYVFNPNLSGLFGGSFWGGWGGGEITLPLSKTR